MLNDYTVNIIYKNRALQSVDEQSYPLNSYCTEQKFNITKVIVDIQNAFYHLEGCKNKDQWDPQTMSYFQHIRHKLLDVANNIERLPQNMRCNGVNITTMKSSQYFANLLAKELGDK